MAGLGASDLDGLAHDFLDACVAILDGLPAEDPALLGSPERAFVSPGEPVWDCCEQMIIHAPSIGQKRTRLDISEGQGHRIGARIPLARLVLTIGRCVPAGTVVGTTYQPPATVDLDAAAAQINADGWALHNGIFNRLAAGTLTNRCDEVIWEGLESATPAGGCAGWTGTFRFQLDGYGFGEAVGT